MSSTAAKGCHDDFEKGRLQVLGVLGLDWNKQRRRAGGKRENALGAIVAGEYKMERLLLAAGNTEGFETIVTMAGFGAAMLGV